MLRTTVRLVACAFVGFAAVPVLVPSSVAAATDGVSMIEFDAQVQSGITSLQLNEAGPWTSLSAGGGALFYQAGGGHLQLGDHADAQPYQLPPDLETNRHGLGYLGSDRDREDCDQESRRFVVDEVAYAGNVLDRLLARLVITCNVNGVQTHIIGVVAYHATAPVYAHDVYPPNDVRGYLGRSASGQVNVGNSGTAPLMFTPATVSGADAASFRIVDDGCAAKPLQPGERCFVKYAVTPLRSGSLSASIDLVSDFNRWSGQAETVPVTATVGTNILPTLRGDEVVQINPVRVLDTREANGVAGIDPLGTTPVVVPIAGRLGIPSTTTGVIANLTVTDPTTAGFVTVHPAGLPRPVVSNINFVAGDTVANITTLALGEGGAIEVFNSSGRTHVVLDVVAYLRAEPEFVNEPGLIYVPAYSPERVVDTRLDQPPLQQGEARPIRLIPFSQPQILVRALLVNVTAVDPSAPTFITTYAYGQPRPLASTLNVRAGETRANLAVVGIDPNGSATFYNNTGSTHLVIDVLGQFNVEDQAGTSESGRIVLIDPFRDLDTRESFGAFAAGAAWGFEYPSTIGGIPVGGVVFNMTITEPTRPGFATMFPWDLDAIPLVSDANFVAGQTVANQVWARLGVPPDNLVAVYNGSSGTVHVVLDIQAVVLK